MTGIFVRIKRNGKWENIEFELLTDKEMNEFVKMKREHELDGWSWAIAYAKFLRDKIKPLIDGLIKEGILEEFEKGGKE